MSLSTDFIERDRLFLQTAFPGSFKTLIHYGAGQSNMRTGNSSDTATALVTHTDAFALDKDAPATDLVIDPLVMDATGTGGTHAVGPGCPIHGVVDRIHAISGHRQIVKQLAVSGAPMLKATADAIGIADGRHWEVDTAQDTSLVLSDDPGFIDGVRHLHMQQVVDAVSFRADFTVENRIMHWWQGEAEVGHMGVSSGVTRANYTAALGRTFDYYRDNWGIDLFCIYLLQSIGSDAEGISANAAQVAEVRDAQQDLIDARSDTISVWSGGLETGAMTVDGNGAWTGGREMYDSTHPSHDAKLAIGRYAGDVIAAHLGLS